MYVNLDQALERIFRETEQLYNGPRWHQDVNSGYRSSALPPEHQLDREQRLTRDGLCKTLLRQSMLPEFYATLILRYADEYAERSTYYERLKHFLKPDTRLPAPLRKNPVLLKLFMSWHLQHPDYRQGKLRYTDKSRMTIHRWNRACEQVAGGWIRMAEGRAEMLLDEAGVIYRQG